MVVPSLVVIVGTAFFFFCKRRLLSPLRSSDTKLASGLVFCSGGGFARCLGDGTQSRGAAQRRAAMKEAAFGSSQGDVQDFRGLFHGELVELTDFDDRANAWTQVRDGFTEDALAFTLDE